MIDAAASTITSPMRAWTWSLRLPSKKAAATPATVALTAKTISRPSTNEAAAASSQSEAGAAKGKRRRASSGSTTSAMAGATSHSVVRGARAASLLITTSSTPTIAASTMSTSKPNLRVRVSSWLMIGMYCAPPEAASSSSRTGIGTRNEARIVRRDDATELSRDLASTHRVDKDEGGSHGRLTGAPSAFQKPCGCHGRGREDSAVQPTQDHGGLGGRGPADGGALVAGRPRPRGPVLRRRSRADVQSPAGVPDRRPRLAVRARRGTRLARAADPAVVDRPRGTLASFTAEPAQRPYRRGALGVCGPPAGCSPRRG